jgi:hypothetical protein
MKEGWVLWFAVGETAGKDAVSSSPKVPTPDLAPDAASAIHLAENLRYGVLMNTTSRLVEMHVK